MHHRLGLISKIFSLVAACFLGWPALVMAADRDIPLQISILSHDTVKNMAEYIGIMYQYLAGIAGVMAVAMIMYGGMKWIFSAGDASKIGTAKEVISHAVIGLILVFGSFLILNTINPALVHLRVDVFDLSGSMVVSGSCPNDGPYEGRFKCGRSYVMEEPEAGMVGTCIGKHCDPGTGGCYEFDGKFGCVKTENCPDTCDGINAMVGIRSDDQLAAACGSSVCRDRITFGCRVLKMDGLSTFNMNHPNTKCIDRLRVGDQHCGRNEDCAYGLMCNFGEAPNTCRDANNLGAGESCDADAHCESKICNKGRDRDQCAPVGGDPVGKHCDRDRDCGEHLGSRRVCNVAFAEDQCVALGSLGEGYDCDRDEVCQSGDCDDPDNNKDGDCTAP